MGRALLTKVIKDAEARHLHSVYTVVRWVIIIIIIIIIIICHRVDNKPGWALARRLGLVSRGAKTSDPSLVTVERILHTGATSQDTANNRGV